MKIDRIIGTIISRLGQRPDLKNRIESELWDVQENVIEKEESFNPWFLVTADPEAFPFAIDAEFVELTEDFLAPYEWGFAYAENSAGQVLPQPMGQRSYDKLKVRNAASDDTQLVGETITHYAIIGTRLYFTPIPTVAGNVHLRYYKKQPMIDSKTLEDHVILEHASDWLMNETGARVAQSIQNVDMMKMFLALAGKARSRVMGQTLKRELEAETVNKGGEL